jgi:Ca-activated chloride channel family protein
MSFVWPEALWLLLAVPALVGLYVLLLRRRSRAAMRYASVALMREALTGRAALRRHLPPLLFLLALVALIIAVARPRATVTLPSEQRTIVLAMDVSLSMRAGDVPPSRMAAARDAAKAFVQEQPPDVRIGIVAFAGSAVIAQQPTRDREELIAAIDGLQLQYHTAIGSAIIMSLATLFPGEGFEFETDALAAGAGGRDRARGASIDHPKSADNDRPKRAEKKESKPVPPGSFPSGAIILLTDGRRTTGPDPIESARLAADRGVKVYTVGFGTAEGGTTEVGGRSIFVRFDEETLQAIAALTGAEYFHARSAADLKRVYDTLDARYVLEKKPTEVSALATAIAAVLVLLAAALSIAWFNRTV